MGIKYSKISKSNKIYDYSIVNIPDETKLIKIISYNLNLKKTINLDVKIKEVIEYLDSSYRNKIIDIICLQGFLDKFSLDSFIREYKNYCLKNKNTMYFAPSFDNVDPIVDSSDNIEIESVSYNKFNINI